MIVTEAAEGSPPVGRSDRVAGNAAIASASNAATMISGGLLAVIVAATIGNNAGTDGFFAAFAIYSTLVAFAQTARATVVARLLEGSGRFSAFDHYLGAALLVMVVVSIAFGPLGAQLARVLTGDLPEVATTTARSALLLLWPAAGLQLFAALGAAMLGALGDFLWAGLAFVGGSLVSIAGFLLLQPSMGIDGLPLALLAGSVLSAAVIATALARVGWRPARATVSEPAEAWKAARVLTIASVSSLLAQLGFIVMVSLGARLGVGVVTIYSYSTMAMVLMHAVFVSSIPMALVVPLARSWDRRPASLLPHHEAIFSAGLLLSLPVVAAAALVGDELGRVVLADFTDDEVRRVVELFVILSFNVVWGLAQIVPYSALVGIGRYGAVGLVTAGAIAVQIGLAFVAVAVDSVNLLAVAVPVSGAVSALAMAALISRGYLREAASRLFAIFARLVAVAAVAFGAPALATEALDVPAPGFVALLIGAALYAALVLAVLPGEREIARRLAAVVRWPQPRAGSSSARS